jgi:hypothetical protein
MEAILIVLILAGLIATHAVAYRLGRAVGERTPRRDDG